MPVSVSTGSLGEPRAKRCKHCDESSHRNESGTGYWQLQLDRDLVDTISAIYPEWFNSATAPTPTSTTPPPTPPVPAIAKTANMAEGGAPPRESPPKAVVDTSPLLNSMEQNKESLKVKLMLRRPVEQLVDQGIMPPLKTPAAFHGQRRQLERAKTGDLLRSKIQQRPSRTELESRHILEPDPHVDPSLADKQRKLKKARLADQLNDQLSHRPGPLELIRKNILHTEEPIEHAVKAGHIPYRATCEGQLNRPQHPLSYVNPEDDSQSSEDNSASPGPVEALEAPKPSGFVVSLIPATTEPVLVAQATVATTPLNLTAIKTDNSDLVFADLCRSVAAPLISQTSASSPASLVSSTSTLSPLSSIASPGPILSQPATPCPPIQVVQRQLVTTPSAIVQPIRTDAPGKDKNRKKSKSKAVPKTRTIKFHEYKGPPNAQKSLSSYASQQGESPYQLLLQQQQLLLQYQLQIQNKSNKPCLILPAAQKTSNDAQSNTTSAQSSPVAVLSASNGVKSAPQPTNRLLPRLEDMKVTDLKAELKRRSLPVSGSKPQLIERLRPFTTQNTPLNNVANTTASTSCDSIQDDPHSPLHLAEATPSPQTTTSEDQEMMEVECEPPSPALSQQSVETPESQELINLQKRRIEELERQLTLSKLKLQAATRADTKAQILVFPKAIPLSEEQQMLQKIKESLQQTQQNLEEQQKLQQQQHIAFQNQKNLTGSLVLNRNDATLVLNHYIPDKNKLINGHNRSSSLPNFINSLIQPGGLVIKQEDMKLTPPPMYDDTLKFSKKNIKSQDVEDVLDILIRNGELPASAAQLPLTPGVPHSIKMEPVYPGSEPFVNNVADNQQQSPQHQQEPVEDVLGLDAQDILNHLDLDGVEFNFMELCGQGQLNNNNGNVDVAMETDDWLDSFSAAVADNFATQTAAPITSNTHMAMNNNVPELTPSQELGYDPLLAIGQNPLDPFNLDEFRTTNDLTASLSWDRLDFAA